MFVGLFRQFFDTVQHAGNADQHNCQGQVDREPPRSFLAEFFSQRARSHQYRRDKENCHGEEELHGKQRMIESRVCRRRIAHDSHQVDDPAEEQQQDRNTDDLCPPGAEDFLHPATLFFGQMFRRRDDCQPHVESAANHGDRRQNV